ncbi:MAG: aminoacyl-tRNA hydrolase [Chloroflexi bacterium RBG_16_56_11]|nr:MAG: aminoacyl-tRNA hydrolase [Chloroflexi bacterium RBG_16_56_11]
MKLIVGLGNPGFLYARNRHNVGFMCVGHLAKAQGIHFDKKQGQARTGIGTIAGKRVVLARPQTFMNASGESVSALARKLNAAPSDIIVIHDDLDLPVGKVRLRLGGGSGGHKGIDSVVARLGSRDFYRVRVGIGRPDNIDGSTEEKESAVIGYVLSDFSPDEKSLIETALPHVSEAVVCLLAEGLAAAMNKFN